jgi:hypothetical protein
VTYCVLYRIDEDQRRNRMLWRFVAVDNPKSARWVFLNLLRDEGCQAPVYIEKIVPRITPLVAQ